MRAAEPVSFGNVSVSCMYQDGEEFLTGHREMRTKWYTTHAVQGEQDFTGKKTKKTYFFCWCFGDGVPPKRARVVDQDVDFAEPCDCFRDALDARLLGA